MAVKIRLQRHGKKNFAFFHIVVADVRAPRDGRYIEQIGSYNPNTNPATIVLDNDKALAWLNVGAQPTLTAKRILSYEGVLLRKHLQGGVAKGALTQEAADKKFEAWKAERDAKINAKKEGLSKDAAAKSKAAVEAEAKVNQERAEALAKKKAEAEEAAKAAAEAAAAEKAAQEAEAAAAEEAPAENTEASILMIQVAQVLKSYGTDGELVLGFRNIGPDDISTTEPLFIYFDGLPVPFFIEKLTKRGQNKALVHLTDIDTFQDAEEIVGRKVYSDSHDFEEDEEDLSMLIGWVLLSPAPCPPDDLRQPSPNDDSRHSALDAESEEDSYTEIGTITDFIDIPNNPCIEVETKNGTAMIPLHEDLIISLDPESREIVMEIPEGLL